MARRKKQAKKHSSWKELSIEEFDRFVRCVRKLFDRLQYAKSKYVELFYFNRITREFHFIYKYKPYDYESPVDWTYDSDNVCPNWSQSTLEYKTPLNAKNTVDVYEVWAAYKLLCLYFFGDESLLEDLYVRARRSALQEKEFYEENPDWQKEREEQYGEKFSVASYTSKCLKEAISRESGYGQLYNSLLYKIQTKCVGMKLYRGHWIDVIHDYIKLAPNSVIRSILYDCFDDSKYQSTKAVKEIDAKIDAFLKRKEEDKECEEYERLKKKYEGNLLN